ncbi:MAG: dihydrofolate reductase [Nannocystaceae bacterium]
MNISIIVAMANNGVIGRNNALPWQLSGDMRFFKATTMGHHVIMGRKTYESIAKPLPGRPTVVVTRDARYRAPGCRVVTSFDQALKLAEEAGDSEVFVAGGAQLYRLALPRAHRLYMTEVDVHADGDTYFPRLERTRWQERSRTVHAADDRNEHAYAFVVLTRDDAHRGMAPSLPRSTRLPTV